MNLNSDKAYDSAAVIKSINNWFTSRNNWIDSQIAKADIANATVTIKSVGTTATLLSRAQITRLNIQTMFRHPQLQKSP